MVAIQTRVAEARDGGTGHDLLIDGFADFSSATPQDI